MSWNYRKMVRQIKDGPFKDEWQCGIVEAYYNEDGNVAGYTKFIVEGTTAKTKELAEQDLYDTIQPMNKAFMKETLNENDLISEEK